MSSGSPSPIIIISIRSHLISSSYFSLISKIPGSEFGLSCSVPHCPALPTGSTREGGEQGAMVNFDTARHTQYTVQGSRLNDWLRCVCFQELAAAVPQAGRKVNVTLNATANQQELWCTLRRLLSHVLRACRPPWARTSQLHPLVSNCDQGVPAVTDVTESQREPRES